MWIHYLGEIMLGVFALLIIAHFGLHFWFKRQKAKQSAIKSDS